MCGAEAEGQVKLWRACCALGSLPRRAGARWEGPLQRLARRGQRAAPVCTRGHRWGHELGTAVGMTRGSTVHCTGNKQIIFILQGILECQPTGWDCLRLNLLTYELSWRPSFKTKEKPNSTSNAGKRRRPISYTTGTVAKPLPGRR